MDKEQIAIARLQDAARLSLHRFKKPLQVTYSGGKDSQVLLALAERAGIAFADERAETSSLRKKLQKKKKHRTLGDRFLQLVGFVYLIVDIICN